MQQWYPGRLDEPLEAVYDDLPPPGLDRWVAVNMVSSVDGAVTIGGVSGPLGAEGDRAGFRALRAAADVILVGAGTARAEQYGPPRPTAEVRATRRDRGQSPLPAVAVVSRSLDLTGADRLLDADAEVVVVTTSDAPADRVQALQARGVRVVGAGQGDVDLAEALDRLASDGLGRVLCEGGPRLNRALLAAGLVDEVFVTVAPVLAGGEGPGIVHGDLPAPARLELVEGRHHGGELLLRYAVRR